MGTEPSHSRIPAAVFTDATSKVKAAAAVDAVVGDTTDEPAPPRWIEYIDIDRIRSAPRNAKRHADVALERSMAAHGYVDAMIMDDRTGLLVAGHGRLSRVKWMRDTGRDAPEGITIRDGRWFAPVQRGWSSKSDEAAEAFLIGHNKIPEDGGWDRDILAITLADLRATDEELAATTGFNDAAIDALLAETGNTPIAPPPPPPPPPPPAPVPQPMEAPAPAQYTPVPMPQDHPAPPPLPDPKHPQWYTVVIRNLSGTTRASWLAHLDTFNGDEVAAFENLLDMPDASGPVGVSEPRQPDPGYGEDDEDEQDDTAEPTEPTP